MPALPKRAKLPENHQAVDRLYRAVAAYVKKRGGSVAVIGGIQVLQWPTDLPVNFSIVVKCTGKMPEYAK